MSILSTFNVGKAKGPDGDEIEIDPAALTGGVIRQAQDLLYWRISADAHLNSASEPFVCLIVPRSAAESLIHDAVQGLHSIARLWALEAAKKDAYLFIIIALYDNEETIVKTLGYLTSAMDDGIIPP